jgi:hypothetical protein
LVQNCYVQDCTVEDSGLSQSSGIIRYRLPGQDFVDRTDNVAYRNTVRRVPDNIYFSKDGCGAYLERWSAHTVVRNNTFEKMHQGLVVNSGRSNNVVSFNLFDNCDVGVKVIDSETIGSVGLDIVNNTFISRYQAHATVAFYGTDEFQGCVQQQIPADDFVGEVRVLNNVFYVQDALQYAILQSASGSSNLRDDKNVFIGPHGRASPAGETATSVDTGFATATFDQVIVSTSDPVPVDSLALPVEAGTALPALITGFEHRNQGVEGLTPDIGAVWFIMT